ncbi:MAG: hypothetical protein OXG55_00950 [bacterium]|nr:hypothetical protein [bacterium]
MVIYRPDGRIRDSDTVPPATTLIRTKTRGTERLAPWSGTYGGIRDCSAVHHRSVIAEGLVSHPDAKMERT